MTYSVKEMEIIDPNSPMGLEGWSYSPAWAIRGMRLIPDGDGWIAVYSPAQCRTVDQAKGPYKRVNVEVDGESKRGYRIDKYGVLMDEDWSAYNVVNLPPALIRA